ncbi:MAG TPA: hypothetical protein VNS32_23425 [Flavisolibacter sp.]|nr:hypothetical protein [Flavisolibacter sp.]
MRLFLTLLMISFVLFSHAQDNTVMVTLNGIGDIKLNMKKAELEKLLGQKLNLKNLATKSDYNNSDTFHCRYKGMDMDIVLTKSFITDSKYDIVVDEITSNNPLLKTRSGIGIGDDKCKIINTYAGYLMTIEPVYDDANSTVISKTRSLIWLRGDTSAIIFYTDNNKITGMSVAVTEGD